MKLPSPCTFARMNERVTHCGLFSIYKMLLIETLIFRQKTNRNYNVHIAFTHTKNIHEHAL